MRCNMRNITTPTKAVSFEDALRNLAAKLTGKPAASLPRTQEAVVQFIADNISSVKELTDAMAVELATRLTQELAEAIVEEVMARLSPAASEEPQEPQEDQDAAPEEQASPEAETPAEEPQAAPKTRKRKT
jgi:hypothetical protein